MIHGRSALLLAAAGMALLLSGCGFLGNVGGTGAVQVAMVGNEPPARSIGPDTSVVPTRYTISGESDAGETFEQLSDYPRVTVSGLAPGFWTINVDAFNEDGLHLLSGTERCLVEGGRAYFAVVELVPASGTGTLELDVSWPAAALVSPTIDATLVPNEGDMTALGFTITTDAAGYNGEVPGGLHTLILRVLDGGYVAAGAVELVRVVADHTTRGDFAFTEVNQPGSLEVGVEVDPGFSEDLDVTIAGGDVQSPFGSAVTLTGTASGTPGNVVLNWYINGTVADVGVASLDITGSTPGYFRVDLIAITADGSQGGSATTWVRIEEPGV